MHLSLRQLETFRLFSRTRNVTETARLLRISQPAVSQTLKEVEEQVGFVLFNRIGGRTQLTAEALALMPDVERLLAQFSTLRGRAIELRDSKAGSLGVASVSTLYRDVLPSALASFRAEHEKVQLRVETLTSSEVVRQVRHDHADVGYVFLPIDEMGVAVQPLLSMRVFCAMRADHALADRAMVTAHDLRDQDVIVQNIQTPPGSVLHGVLDRDTACAARVIGTNMSTSALHMVRHGLGIALIHPLTLPLEDLSGVVCVPLDPPIYQTLGMIYSRQRPVARVVIRFEKHMRRSLRDFCASMVKRGFECELLI
jgi:DNA-binding transcriptional LysR family regulator